jgi:hypothetical protein
MGRTIPSFRIALSIEQAKWKPFRNRLFFLLRAVEQNIFEDGTGRAYYEVDNGRVISIKFYHNLTGSNYRYQNGSIFFSKNGGFR